MDIRWLRSQARARWRTLEVPELARISARIETALLAILERQRPQFKDSHPIVGLYRALPGEIPTDSWARLLLAHGYRLAYPKVDINSPWGLRFFLLPALDPDWTSWADGPHGVREPRGSWPEVVPDSISALIIPGLAFGGQGERLGRGGGFYDRLLASSPSPLRVGVAPDRLLYPELPVRPWDQPVDIILTERRFTDVSQPAAGKTPVVSGRCFR